MSEKTSTVPCIQPGCTNPATLTAMLVAKGNILTWNLCDEDNEAIKVDVVTSANDDLEYVSSIPFALPV